MQWAAVMKCRSVNMVAVQPKNGVSSRPTSERHSGGDQRPTQDVARDTLDRVCGRIRRGIVASERGKCRDQNPMTRAYDGQASSHGFPPMLNGLDLGGR